MSCSGEGVADGGARVPPGENVAPALVPGIGAGVGAAGGAVVGSPRDTGASVTGAAGPSAGAGVRVGESGPRVSGATESIGEGETLSEMMHGASEVSRPHTKFALMMLS